MTASYAISIQSYHETYATFSVGKPISDNTESLHSPSHKRFMEKMETSWVESNNQRVVSFDVQSDGLRIHLHWKQQEAHAYYCITRNNQCSAWMSRYRALQEQQLPGLRALFFWINALTAQSVADDGPRSFRFFRGVRERICCGHTWF